MRLRSLITTVLACVITCAVSAQAYYEGPVLTLEGEAEMEGGIPELADYTKEREIDGLGWKIATAVRKDETGALDFIMRRGLTVIVPDKGAAKPMKHCYVLAGFDVLPDDHLLVCIRDPEVYWEPYDYKEGLVDPVQLVWFDKDWNEYDCILLDYSTLDYPDDFLLSKQEYNLIAIRHPVREDDPGQQTQAGQSLDVIRLKDGLITPLPLPEADEEGLLPASWLPLKMRWEENGWLQVQAGSSLRRYSLEW